MYSVDTNARMNVSIYTRIKVYVSIELYSIVYTRVDTNARMNVSIYTRISIELYSIVYTHRVYTCINGVYMNTFVRAFVSVLCMHSYASVSICTQKMKKLWIDMYM